MTEMLSIEALAHYTRGMTTMFFILWTIRIFKYRHHNRMMKVMAVAVGYITFGYIKDVVFLFNPWMNDPFIQDVVSLTDILCTPFVTAFFLEATRPHIVTVRRLLTAVLPFALPVPLYLLTGDRTIVTATYVLSAVCSVSGFILTLYFVARYSRCISDNYSYTQYISVKWVVGCATTYFAWFVIYIFCFSESTWAGEVFFDLCSILIWSVIWLFSRRHHVIIEMLGKEMPAMEASVKETQVQSGTSITEAPRERRKSPAKETFFSKVLVRKMETEKLFLNPRLSLSDLALAVGTNKSYLSELLNNQGKTFYDYINEFRIAEACRLLDSVAAGERLNMTDVATRSGFNSISSFNRYFYKIKEMTPTAYLRFRLLSASDTEERPEANR